MADARLTPEAVIRNGLAATYNGSLSTGNTYLIKNPGNVVLHFKKSQATDCIVTLITQNVIDGQAVADRTVTVPATTGDRFIGPFPANIYEDAVGDLRFTMDNIDGVTVAVLRLP